MFCAIGCHVALIIFIIWQYCRSSFFPFFLLLLQLLLLIIIVIIVIIIVITIIIVIIVIIIILLAQWRLADPDGVRARVSRLVSGGRVRRVEDDAAVVGHERPPVLLGQAEGAVGRGGVQGGHPGAAGEVGADDAARGGGRGDPAVAHVEQPGGADLREEGRRQEVRVLQRIGVVQVAALRNTERIAATDSEVPNHFFCGGGGGGDCVTHFVHPAHFFCDPLLDPCGASICAVLVG